MRNDLSRPVLYLSSENWVINYVHFLFKHALCNTNNSTDGTAIIRQTETSKRPFHDTKSKVVTYPRSMFLLLVVREDTFLYDVLQPARNQPTGKYSVMKL